MMRTKSKDRGGAAQWVSSSGQYGGHLPPQMVGDTGVHPMDMPHHSGETSTTVVGVIHMQCLAIIVNKSSCINYSQGTTEGGGGWSTEYLSHIHFQRPFYAHKRHILA